MATTKNSTTAKRENALDLFAARKAEIDRLLARLQASSEEHFGCDPEALNCGDAGSLAYVIEQLTEAARFIKA